MENRNRKRRKKKKKSEEKMAGELQRERESITSRNTTLLSEYGMMMMFNVSQSVSQWGIQLHLNFNLFFLVINT